MWWGLGLYVVGGRMWWGLGLYVVGVRSVCGGGSVFGGG